MQTTETKALTFLLLTSRTEGKLNEFCLNEFIWIKLQFSRLSWFVKYVFAN